MVVFGTLIVNIFLIETDKRIIKTAEYANKKSVLISTSRGMIYDTNMKRLVNNESENLTVCLPVTKAFDMLSPFLSGNEKSEAFENLSKGKVIFHHTGQRIDGQYVKTVSLVKRYSQNQLCAHLIGHLDDSLNGAAGLEKIYDEYLSQQSGSLKAVWSVDALGHILQGDELSFESDNYLSSAGIQITINSDIQKIVEEVMQTHNIDKGAVVIMNAESGEILASASTPVFNPNDLTTALNDENKPFVNRALSPYSVGSVFKPVLVAVALENNIDFNMNCNGQIQIGRTVFHCYNGVSHGFMTMQSGTQRSCNSYFIALGQKLGAEKIISMCRNMGLGKQIELADDYYLSAGVLPSAESITSPQSLANLSFGQGELLASPVQMAALYSVFANGGYYREPTLMKGIIDSNGNTVQRVRLPEKCKVLNSNTAQKIDDILESVVTSGNGYRGFSELIKGHGKTATAQTGWFENGREINHTWFCGYFSAFGTTYTVVIFKEDGTTGAIDCAPVFKDISEEIVKNITD